MAQFLLLEKSTKHVLNYNVQPAPDINQWINDVLAGIDPSLELVASYQPYEQPVIDNRLVNLITIQSYSGMTHPVYSQLKTWLITHVTEDKTIKEKKSAVDEAESGSNETLIPTNKRLKYTILCVDNILKHIGYDPLTTSLNAKRKKQIKVFTRIADKIRNNDLIRDEKYIAIDNLTNPDLDSNWDINDFTEDV
jgi:hypothetical protein